MQLCLYKKRYLFLDKCYMFRPDHVIIGRLKYVIGGSLYIPIVILWNRTFNIATFTCILYQICCVFRYQLALHVRYVTQLAGIREVWIHDGAHASGNCHHDLSSNLEEEPSSTMYCYEFALCTFARNVLKSNQRTKSRNYSCIRRPQRKKQINKRMQFALLLDTCENRYHSVSPDLQFQAVHCTNFNIAHQSGSQSTTYNC
jgi:hypothetical protein